jgi:hypothetical protein
MGSFPGNKMAEHELNKYLLHLMLSLECVEFYVHALYESICAYVWR